MQEKEMIHRLIDVIRFKEDYHLKTTQLLSQDLYVLERLYFSESVRVLEFAEKYHLAPSTLTGILDRLSQRKLINRQRSKTDRKAVEIVVTTWGKRVIEMHLAEDEVFCSKFFGVLAADEQEIFKRLLSDLLNNLKIDEIFTDGKGEK